MKKIEIMAPAGSLKSCIAALQAGADAVYLGFSKFNARRPAENFDLPALKKVTSYIHKLGKKVYLTLNIDLKSKELYEAFQLFMLCAMLHIDAVIVKDPALILLYNRYFKGAFELHLSTQTAITASPGARFALSCGAHRIVLARELTLEEIKLITPLIETEIFTEGSMCFSISGRCLMSSWVGGRSGNRGACTAPCRIKWDHQGTKGAFFSMKDLSLVSELESAARAGIKAAKIEGRLKNASWVSSITGFYNRALTGGDDQDSQKHQELIKTIREELKQYSARETGQGHFYGHDNLTGPNEEWEGYKKDNQTGQTEIPGGFSKDIKLVMTGEKSNLVCTVFYENLTEKITLKVPPPPRKARTVSLEALSDCLAPAFKDYSTSIRWEVEDIQVKSSQFQKIEKNIITTIQTLLKTAHSLPVPRPGEKIPGTDLINAITEEELSFLKGKAVKNERKQLLGSLPDRLIISPKQIEAILNSSYPAKTVVVELAENNGQDRQIDQNKLRNLADSYNLILSIPDVLFEQEAGVINSLTADLIKAGFTDFEANSFTGFQILSDKSCTKHAGPWFPVLNHMAAEFFKERGYKSIYGAVEGEASLYKALAAFTSLDLNVLSFGRLPLFISRARDPLFVPGEQFKDKIGIEVECFNRASISYFVSDRYYSLLGEKVQKEAIGIDSSAADLRYFSNPAQVLKALKQHKYPAEEGHSFNFFSKLV